MALPSSSLRVECLSQGVDDSALLENFQDFGAIHAVVIKHKETGTSQGFGFVAFPAVDDATRALSSLNRRAIGGLEISLSYAKPYATKATIAAEADALLVEQALSNDSSSSPSLSESAALPATLMPEFVPRAGADRGRESTMPRASSGSSPLGYHHVPPRTAGAWSRGDSPSRFSLGGGEGGLAQARIPHDSFAPHESMSSSTGPCLPFDYSGESPSHDGYIGSGSAGVPNRRLHFSRLPPGFKPHNLLELLSRSGFTVDRHGIIADRKTFYYMNFGWVEMLDIASAVRAQRHFDNRSVEGWHIHVVLAPTPRTPARTPPPVASLPSSPLSSRQAEDVPAALGLRLHVMNLEPHMTASRLALAFRDYAPVHAAIVPPASATSVAQGFVTFSDVASATQALAALDNVELDRFRMEIKYATPPRSPILATMSLRDLRAPEQRVAQPAAQQQASVDGYRSHDGRYSPLPITVMRRHQPRPYSTAPSTYQSSRVTQVAMDSGPGGPSHDSVGEGAVTVAFASGPHAPIRAPEAPSQVTVQLHVSGLPENAGRGALYSVFDTFGATYAEMLSSGTSDRVGIVSFGDMPSALEAQRAVNGASFQGHVVRVWLE